MKHIFPFLILILIAACTDGEDNRIVPPSQPGVITFGSMNQDGSIEWVDGRSKSRSANSQYAAETTSATRAETDLVSEMPANIGVFAFGDKDGSTTVFDNQKALFIDSVEYTSKPFTWNYWDKTTDTGLSRWPYTTSTSGSQQKQWEPMHYRFFAYSPWSIDSDVQIGIDKTYSDFNRFTWNNIPEYADRDYVVANEIPYVDNSDGKRQTEEVVTFQMRHIMSRIRFFFKMSPYYRTIRSIKLNSITVQTSGKRRNATFTFIDNHLDTSNIWSTSTDGAPTTQKLIHASGLPYPLEALGKDGGGKEKWPDEPFTSLYVWSWPQANLNQLTITADYSTFDSENTETRHTTITNTVDISPAWTLKPGYYYDMKINVVPDYLYVLSDNDQTFDGYVIIKDK